MSLDIKIETIYKKYSENNYFKHLDTLVEDMIHEYSTYSKIEYSQMFHNYILAFKLLYENVDVFNEDINSSVVDQDIIGTILLSIAQIYYLTNYFIVNNVFVNQEGDEPYKLAKTFFDKYREKFESKLQQNFNITNLKDPIFLKQNTYDIAEIYIEYYLQNLQQAQPNFVQPNNRSSRGFSNVASRVASIFKSSRAPAPASASASAPASAPASASRQAPVTASRFGLSRKGGNSKSKKIRKLKKYQKL